MHNMTFGYIYFLHFSGRRLSAFEVEKSGFTQCNEMTIWPIRSFRCMLCCSDSESKWWILVSSLIMSCEINFCWVTSVLFEKFFRNLCAVLVLAWQTLCSYVEMYQIFMAQKSYCACRVLSIATIRSKYYFNFILIRTRSGRELFDHPSYINLVFKRWLLWSLSLWYDTVNPLCLHAFYFSVFCEVKGLKLRGTIITGSWY